MKRCAKCKLEKPLDNFSTNPRSSDGRYSYCYECARAIKKAYFETRPEARERQRKHARAYAADHRKEACKRASEHYYKNKSRHFATRLRRECGLSIEQYDVLHEHQQGVCAICRRKCSNTKMTRLCVDHDHNTNQIRGLLCNNCNRAIGLLQDNTDVLAAAIEYLQNPPAKTVLT
jgi:hypothetical protein